MFWATAARGRPAEPVRLESATARERSPTRADMQKAKRRTRREEEMSRLLRDRNIENRFIIIARSDYGPFPPTANLISSQSKSDDPLTTAIL